MTDTLPRPAGTRRHARRGIDALAALSTAKTTQCSAATAAVLIVAVSMALLHMLQIFAYVLPAGQFKNLHLGMAVMLAYLRLLETTPLDRVWARRWVLLLAALTLIPIVYIHLEYQALVEVRSFKPNQWDTWVAIGLLALTFFATAREWGWTIPALGIVSIIYGYYGYLLPGELFSHAGIMFSRLVAYTSIPYFQGLLGGLTELSAGTIFMFMLFAGVLTVTGGIDFIIKIAFSIGGRSRAGPAQVAVVASGFMAMISGSVVANVASTGAMTIPMMKRYGFRPEFAGAVEAVASTGGQLTPPVMGLAAFLIVGITGIPYVEVMAAAIFPALIYYVYLIVAVHLRAVGAGLDARGVDPSQMVDEDGRPALESDISLGRACIEYGHLLFGIGILIYFLVGAMPPGTAALYAMLTLLATDGIKRLWRHRSHPMAGIGDVLRMLVQSLESGARAGAQVATVIAVCAILIEFMSVTGFAQKLSFLMLELADGSLPLLMLIAAVTCLAFGLGMPTTASYILVALLGAPALVELGVPLLAAHMFVFFFANVSALTPPVAIVALVASNIAKSSFMPTAFLSVRLGLPGFLLPIVFVVHPQILGLEGGWLAQVGTFLLALIAICALNTVFEGRFLTRLSAPERALMALGSMALLYPGWNSGILGALVIGAVALRQLVSHRALAKA